MSLLEKRQFVIKTWESLETLQIKLPKIRLEMSSYFPLQMTTAARQINNWMKYICRCV